MKHNLKKTIADADQEPLVIFGFDRITLWIDRPELPIAVQKLEKHCTKVGVHLKQMKYNAQWKLKLEIFQPTKKCLRLLRKALGNDIAAKITYVEIACDIPAINKKQAVQWRNSFLATACKKYSRQYVVREKTTWYYDRRDDWGKRRANVLVVYADKPSKLNNAQPTDDSLPCLHIERRATGSDAFAGIRIGSLTDLIEFDHRQFWNDHIRLYQLPKPAKLGRLLAKICGTEINVSSSAFRKRASVWKNKNSIKNKFVMHNAILTTSEIKRHLTTVSFSEWLKKTVFRK
jgi:hypothetical protein